jgi:hypothetical protein
MKILSPFWDLFYPNQSIIYIKSFQEYISQENDVLSDLKASITKLDGLFYNAQDKSRYYRFFKIKE